MGTRVIFLLPAHAEGARLISGRGTSAIESTIKAELDPVVDAEAEAVANGRGVFRIMGVRVKEAEAAVGGGAF